jgi:hypothetical protein
LQKKGNKRRKYNFQTPALNMEVKKLQRKIEEFWEEVEM